MLEGGVRDTLILLVLLLYFFKPFLGPIVFATILAMTLYPIYKKKPGYLTAAVLTLGVTVLLVFLTYHFSAYLYDQALVIIAFFNRLSPDVKLQLIDIGSQVPIYDFALQVANSIPGMAIKALMTVITTFYFLLDGHKIKNFAKTLFPPEKAQKMVEEASYNLRSIVMGVFVSMFAYTLLGTIILYITQTPGALLYAVAAGLFGPIPLVAGWMIYGYIIVQKLLAGQIWGALLVLAYLTIWYTFAELYFRVRYRGRMHPAALLLSMVSGVAIFGFPGFIAGPILVSLAYTWLRVEQAG